tara:strand:- start:490 stop:660 length:171 start_codon:yes stop_codon:yes gene_type:complete
MRKIKHKVQKFRDRQNAKNHSKKAKRNAVRKAKVAALRRPVVYRPTPTVGEETLTL